MPVHLSCSSVHLPPREEADRIYRLGRSMFLSTVDGMLDGVDPANLTHANVMNGNVKYKTLRKNKLQVLCGNLLDHIK
jgi:hypothetical protein